MNEQRHTDAESPADTTQGRHTAAQTPPRGTDAGEAGGDPGSSVIHACPPSGCGIMPCCGRAPFEVPRTDRIARDPALVTCGRPERGSGHASGWCPSCGRGDLAPTGEQLAQAQREADRLRVVLGRVRERAAEWASLAPADDWGPTPGDTVLADAGRHLIALIGPGGAVERLAGPNGPGGVDTDGPQR